MPAAWPSGFELLEFDEIDSTNEEARRRAEAGEPGPVWIRGGLQTKGRGRRGRDWVSPTGNLFATLMIRPPLRAAEAARLSFAAALSVADMFDLYVDPARIKLKWPNDVQLDGGKVCGILLESSAHADGNVDWLAIGIGVNLANHPHLDEPRTIALADVTAPPTPTEALTHLAAAFARWFAAYEDEGFSALREPWLARARGLGEPITVRLPREELHGVFAGIDGEGALVLETQGATRKITAGEVFFD
jgi:BirA family biotin operon repressor/biotin-[acetyl-CoA-carboxylase] ligase